MYYLLTTEGSWREVLKKGITPIIKPRPEAILVRRGRGGNWEGTGGKSGGGGMDEQKGRDTGIRRDAKTKKKHQKGKRAMGTRKKEC